MKGNKGFTLLEMLIVIVIVAVLAAIATPSLISWRANSSLSGDTRTLKADLERTRSRAIRDNANATLNFTGSKSYTYPGGGSTILSRSLNNTSISGLASVTFDSRGRATNTGTVTLSNGTKATQITVNMIGSVRIN